MNCTGLNRCIGASIPSQTCCNYFDMASSCVTACPTNSTPNAEFVCMCDVGFALSGNACVAINECEGAPCQNGGTCTDLLNGFTCDCVPGYMGATCETNINECKDNPCQNGGNCIDLVNAFSCNCMARFTGMTCQINACEFSLYHLFQDTAAGRII